MIDWLHWLPMSPNDWAASLHIYFGNTISIPPSVFGNPLSYSVHKDLSPIEDIMCADKTHKCLNVVVIALIYNWLCLPTFNYEQHVHNTYWSLERAIWNT